MSASSSRLEPDWSDSDSFADDDALEVEIEWAQEIVDTLELELDPEPEPWNQRHHPFLVRLSYKRHQCPFILSSR